MPASPRTRPIVLAALLGACSSPVPPGWVEDGGPTDAGTHAAEEGWDAEAPEPDVPAAADVGPGAPDAADATDATDAADAADAADADAAEVGGEGDAGAGCPPGGCDSDGDGDPDPSDCAPDDPAVHHGADEPCNDVDDDCDGDTDEEGPDTDGDGIPDCVDDNLPPTADAGPDQVVAERTLVELDGARSQDPDGDELTWSWRLVGFPGGSAARLEDADTATPSFTVDLPGTYEVSLTVADTWLRSEPDTVAVTAQDVPDRPISVIAPLVGAPIGGEILLDGSGSHDPDGDALTFLWDLLEGPEGSAAAVTDPVAEITTIVPDLPGEYLVALTVSDGALESARRTALVHTANSPPAADAGPDLEVAVGATATLDGTRSGDPDGDPLAWAWTPVRLPEGSAAALDDPAAAAPSFVADLPGLYTFSLTVADPAGLQAGDEVSVRTENRPPVAEAGEPRAVEHGVAVWLDGGLSEDPDGDPISYAWRLALRPADSQAELSDAERRQVWFTADVPGTFVAELVVSDGRLESAPDQVFVDVNAAPVADPGPDLEGVPAGHLVVLDGSASYDPDDFPEPASFGWRLDATPQGSTRTSNDITDRFTPVAGFVPDLAGLYRFTLSVDDGLSRTQAEKRVRAIRTPDLVAEVDDAPEAGHPHAALAVRAAIRNVGLEAAGPATAALWLRDRLGGATHRLGTAPHGGVFPGGQIVVELTADAAPAGLVSHPDWELVVRADDTDVVPELDETNNDAAVPFEVVLGNLAAGLVDVPVARLEGQQVSVALDVGFAAVSAVQPETPVVLPEGLTLAHVLRLVPPEGEPVELARQEAELPDPGATERLVLRGVLPAPLEPDPGYWLEIAADAEDVLLEDDEEDGTERARLEVVRGDLSVEVLDSTPVQTRGGAVQVSWRIALAAESQADPPNLLHGLMDGFIRNEVVLDDGQGPARVIGFTDVLAPIPGGTREGVMDGTVPRDAAAGPDCRLVVRIDAAEAVAEGDEGNNEAARTFEVLGSNLRPVVRDAPLAGLEGERFVVTYDVPLEAGSLADPENDISGVAVGGFRRILSLVPPGGGDAVVLHSEWRPGAPPGDPATRTVRGYLPRPFEPGAGHVLRLVVDTNDERVEDDELDNTLELPFELVRGDLRTWIDSAPASAHPGDSIRVRYGMHYDAVSAAAPPTDLSGISLPSFVRRVLLRDVRDGSERSLASQEGGGQRPNEDDFGVMRPVLPADVEPGDSYELVVRLDEEDAIAEGEGGADNDEAAAAFSVEP